MSDLSSIDIISNETYADGYPHDGWTRLRREAPVYWYERPGVQPFWAITKHADLVAISKQPKIFENAPRLAVFPGLETEVAEPPPARHLLNMDPPDHGRFRRLISSRFAPRALIPMTADVEPIAAEILDAFGNDGALSEADFVTGVSARLPLAVLADMLGVPRSDWQRLFQWTNETVGASDPEYQLEGETAPETADRARQELFQYFWSLVEERRRTPTEDIISVLANAELDGEPVPPFELVSYFYLLVVAGNETTRNATTGGLLALLQHPEEFDKLRRDPGLLDSAVEEIVRWTSPVIQFCRTPNQDVVLRGQRIRAGDNLTLFYPSANRDEEVFDAPFRFRVDRTPNPHLAFGIGEHFCLGANLARVELRVIFRQLIARLAEAELAGPISRLHSSFVGGIKSMPIRYRLTPAA